MFLKGFGLALATVAALPANALKLWTKQSADKNTILLSAYTIGNGKQGGMSKILKMY